MPLTPPRPTPPSPARRTPSWARPSTSPAPGVGPSSSRRTTTWMSLTSSSEPRRDELAVRLGAGGDRLSVACLAAGRKPADVTLIAVTKTFPASDVRLLNGLGVTDFGENRDAEAAPKAEQCADLDLVWHFVGQLQTNKAASVARYATFVHSVDRLRLVHALGAGGPPGGPGVPGLVGGSPGGGGHPLPDRGQPGRRSRARRRPGRPGSGAGRGPDGRGGAGPGGRDGDRPARHAARRRLRQAARQPPGRAGRPARRPA